MSELIQAGRELIADEKRRRARGQRTRMGDQPLARLEAEVRAIEATGEMVHVRAAQEARGIVAVELFGYQDTFDEEAASVITDILHAVAVKGYSPQSVLDQAAIYYAEER